MQPNNFSTAGLEAAILAVAEAFSQGSQNTSFWQELARASTQGAVATLATATFLPKKYLMIITNMHSGGSTLTAFMRFNGDAATNYIHRTSENTVESSSAAQTGFQLGSNALVGQHGEFIVNNEAGYHKVGHGIETFYDASNLYRNTFAGKWANASVQISQVSLVATAGNFQAGSEVIVLGHD